MTSSVRREEAIDLAGWVVTELQLSAREANGVGPNRSVRQLRGVPRPGTRPFGPLEQIEDLAVNAQADHLEREAQDHPPQVAKRANRFQDGPGADLPRAIGSIWHDEESSP